MIIADATTPILLGGGAGGLLAFVLAMYKAYSSERIWKSLVTEIRKELTDCRKERQEDRQRIEDLEGEVGTLRRELHADRWLGIDPVTRPVQGE